MLKFLVDIILSVLGAINRLLDWIGDKLPLKITDSIPVDYFDSIFGIVVGIVFAFNQVVSNALSLPVGIGISFLVTTLLAAVKRREDRLKLENDEKLNNEKIDQLSERNTELQEKITQLEDEIAQLQSRVHYLRDEMDSAKDVMGSLVDALRLASIQEKSKAVYWKEQMGSLLATLCRSLGAFIRNHFGGDPYTTIYQSVKYPNNGAYWVMVGFDLSATAYPKSFETKYQFDDMKELFIRIATTEDNDRLFCLATEEDIRAGFNKHPKSVSREERVCQYAGRPICAAGNVVPFILQFDVSEKGILGKDENEMKENLEEVFVPYTYALMACYYISLILSCKEGSYETGKKIKKKRH